MSENNLTQKQDLLRLLDQDYHQTHEQLARQLGATPAQVGQMIRELEDDRILVKCQPIINWEKAGLEEAEHAAKFAELLGEVVTTSTKKNLEMRVDAENGATARNTGSFPNRSANRPTTGAPTSVRIPPST